MTNFKKAYNFATACMLAIIFFSSNAAYSSDTAYLRVPVNKIGSSRINEAIERLSNGDENRIERLFLSGDFLENIENSARIFLPHTELLKAINILLAHEDIANVKAIAVDFHAGKNFAVIKDGMLEIGVTSAENLDAIGVLAMLKQQLGWDFINAIAGIKNKFPYLLLSDKDFGAINVIIHKRMAGLGDLVFVANTAQVLRKALPGKKIRIILHSDADFRLMCATKLLMGLNPQLAVQEVEDGIEVVNAEKAGLEHMPPSRMEFGLEQYPWYWAQENIIKENDVSIVYAIDETPKAVFENRRYFQYYAGKAKTRIFMHEVGFPSLTQNPLAYGDAHLGFGEYNIGMSPVSPKSKELYSRKYPRVDKDIQSERSRIIKKLEGWEVLDRALGQNNLDVTIASEWGFLYSHESGTIRRYFDTFGKSMEDEKSSLQYKETPKTFFVMCGKSDVLVQQEVSKIAREKGYNLFVYANENKNLEPANLSKDSKITIMLDYSVPRKLFGELFLYSDDLPTVVSGQDNLANILYLNTLSSGRPFFFESLIFQENVEFSIRQFVEAHLGKEDADYFYNLFRLTLKHNDQKEMFSAPRKYRILFKKVAMALDKHRSFVPETYYLILRQLDKYASNANRAGRAEDLISKQELQSAGIKSDTINRKIKKDKLVVEVSKVTAKLQKKLKRPPNIRETAEAMPSLRISRNPAVLLYKRFQAYKLNPYDYGISRFSGKANLVIKKNFAFAGTRIFLPPQLSGRIEISAEKTPISKETKIDIVDRKNPENRLTIKHVKDQNALRLTYARPLGRDVSSYIEGIEGKTSVTFTLNPVFSDFYDAVFSIPLSQGEGRLKAVAKHLRDKKFGVYYRQKENEINFHGRLIFSSWYETHPGRVKIYRDRANEPRFILFEDVANPDNITGYEWRDSSIITLTKGAALKAASHINSGGEAQPVYNLPESDAFRIGFDEPLDKGIEVGIAAPDDTRLSDRSIGAGRFTFRVKTAVTIISMEGQRSKNDITRDDRSMYPIRIVRVDDGSEIKISYRNPDVQGEFTVEGLDWEDGSPVILKGHSGYEDKRGYFNISTIIEMVRLGLLEDIKASKWLLETFGFDKGQEGAIVRNSIRRYKIEETESGEKFLVEDVLVDPKTFLPRHSAKGLSIFDKARTGL